MRNYFLEVPVYSMSKEKYNKKAEILLEKEIKKYNLTEDNPNYELVVKQIKSNLIAPWEYNQIIGYIRLYKQVDTLRGDLWWINKKKITLHPGKKAFYYRVCYPEWGLPFLNKIKTSEDFFHMLCEKLPNDTTGFLKGKYVDLTFLKKIGPYIDWKRLLEFEA